MPWPIPTLTAGQRPAPINLHRWLLIVISIMTAGAAVVLLLWPQGKPTNAPQFWLLLVGVPASVCIFLFGMTLTRWGLGQLLAQTSEREVERFSSLWRAWARRHLAIMNAVAFLPTVETAEQIVAGEVNVPINVQRTLGFHWGESDTADVRWTRLLGFVVDRFAVALAGLRSVEVMLILDEASREKQAQWTDDARRLLAAAVPGVALNIRVAESLGCAQWMASQVDTDERPAQLIVAAQIWPDKGERTFSEGAAALLLPARVISRRNVGEQAEEGRASLYRPMTSEPAAIAEDVSTMLSMQVGRRTAIRTWSVGLTTESNVALLGALSADCPERPTVTRLDDVFGLSGPVGEWLAIAMAWEAGVQSRTHQLVAWRQRDDEHTHLCVVAPSQPEGNVN